MLICAILVLTKILIRFDQIYQKDKSRNFYSHCILDILYIHIYINIVIFICFRWAELVCLFVLNANIRFVWKAFSCLLNLSKIYISLSIQNLWFAFLSLTKFWQSLCSIRRNFRSRFLSHVFRFSKFILGH